MDVANPIRSPQLWAERVICVIGLNEVPSIDELRLRVSRAQSEPLAIGDLPLQFDFGRRNHFIATFQVSDAVAEMPYSHVAMLHCSVPEVRANPGIHGALLPSATSIASVETPAGSITYVAGDAAHEFLAAFRDAADFAAAKRELIGMKLFPKGELLSNRLHQGCAGLREIVIGAHVPEGPTDRTGFVYLLGLESPSFLYDIEDTACIPTQYQATLSIPHVLPHGGGAEYGFLGAAQVEIDPDGELRMLLTTHSGNVMDVRTTQDLPYQYRGRETFDWCLAKGICAQRCKLIPVHCVRV